MILPEDYDLPGLGDSKALTEKRREALFPEIQRQAVAWAAAMATVPEIENLNIRGATRLAMQRAVEALSVRPGELWIDGDMVIDAGLPAQCFPKGDRLYPCISAASVVAKVTRDHWMLRLHEQYPQYGFDRHKGYGTEAHARALMEHGPCSEHRALFVRTFLAHKAPPVEPVATVGACGEKQAGEHLKSLGFRIVKTNFHSRYGEIDIIAEDGEYLVFAEVKTRKNSRFASGAEAVDARKQKKLLQTARYYLATHHAGGLAQLQPRFDVIEIYTESGQLNHIANAFSE